LNPYHLQQVNHNFIVKFIIAIIILLFFIIFNFMPLPLFNLPLLNFPLLKFIFIPFQLFNLNLFLFLILIPFYLHFLLIFHPNSPKLNSPLIFFINNILSLHLKLLYLFDSFVKNKKEKLTKFKIYTFLFFLFK
jgi:hypothetical protein